MHKVQIDIKLFDIWASKHLKHNGAIGSNGIHAKTEYDYIEFSLGEYRNDYDFMISLDRYPTTY
jgi:hypothetical protein